MKQRLLIGLFAFLSQMLAFAADSTARDKDGCAGARDLKLVNGKIVTMDKQNTVVSEVTIQRGLVTATGNALKQQLDPCTKTINLRGRTVVPGIVDNHNHIVLLGMRPAVLTVVDGKVVYDQMK